MSHYQMEIIMPSCEDVKGEITKLLAPFEEEPQDPNSEDHLPQSVFWDWWVVGGRWSGNKLLASLDKVKLDEFYMALSAANITVSGLQFGKQTLSPSSQSEKVDALWNEIFPDSPVKTCPIFDNYSGSYGDIMLVKDIPATAKCHRVMIAAPDYENEHLHPVFMTQATFWNGVTDVDAKWNGTIAEAIKEHLSRVKYCSEKYAVRVTPKDGWIVVTVEYHS